MSYIYVASPYTSPDPAVMQSRYEQVEQYTAWLLKNGDWAYSPIVHCHPMTTKYNLPVDAEYWQQYNNAMLRGARVVHFLQMEGWEDSRGMAHERRVCDIAGIPWVYRSLEDFDARRLLLPTTRTFGGLYRVQDYMGVPPDHPI